MEQLLSLLLRIATLRKKLQAALGVTVAGGATIEVS
jgi:hypothetical protein